MRRWGKGSWKCRASRVSIVDYGSVAFEYFFGFAVKVAGHFMNLVFLAADGAAHAHPSALAMDFKFA